MPTDEKTNQPVFSGVFRHTLDEKHRVTIPSRWRKGEQDQFYLMPSPDSAFLSALPPAQFQKVNDDLMSNPKISPADRRRFARHYFSQAQHCVIDRQGRLLLPDDFRLSAALEGELLLLGAFDRFEIWNPQRWTQSSVEGAATFQQIANVLGV